MKTKMQHVIAFVTGGTSGIGRAIVERIINQGGKAAILDRAVEGRKLAEELGANAIFCKVDVTSEEDVQQALTQVKEQFGGINVVINCAGIAIVHHPYDFETETAHPLEIYRKVMDVNALGTFNVTRLAAGVMAANMPDENQQRGLFINIVSIWAHDAPSCGVAYAASKAAVRGMTIPLARSFAPKGIRVVTIAPGYVDTPMAIERRRNEALHKITIAGLLTPKRMAFPDEIAHLAQCIIENPYINAVNMEISGGFHYIRTKEEI
ncbi:3-hydroxyacyl-CoA dehydrogenase type-2 [Diachasma alloeum]|uniref:3-hydroxyacyl-CoA dehydrogenase type-2 n=1 Tax=Diachasma alloeum TaxID=454923 RepID=UPI00073827CA|nr:3-hydroxyacyl-CoA dehydrogenase type-2 [Diachasma alloeum]